LSTSTSAALPNSNSTPITLVIISHNHLMVRVSKQPRAQFLEKTRNIHEVRSNC
jgi:hypothetical protein